MPGTHGAGCSCADEAPSPGSQCLLPYVNTTGITALNEEVYIH